MVDLDKLEKEIKEMERKVEFWLEEIEVLKREHKFMNGREQAELIFNKKQD